MVLPPMKNFKDPDQFSWKDLMSATWYFLEGYRRPFIFWTITLFIVFFYQLVPPVIIGKIIDFFTTYKPGQSLSLFYGLAIFLGVANALAAIIRLTAKNRLAELGAELNYSAKVKGFEKLVDFSLSWHDKENSGNKVQRIQNGLTSFSDMRRLINQDGFQVTTAILGIIFVFLFLSPLFVIFLVVYLSVFFAINFSFYSRMLTLQNEFNKVREAATGNYFEGLSNVLTIKTLGAKDSFKKNIHSSEQLSKEYGYKLIAIGINKWKAFQIFNAASIVVYLLMIGRDLLGGVITIGSIFIFYTYLMRLVDAAGTSTEAFERLIEIKSSIARMMPIYWEEEELVHGTVPFPKTWKEIVIKDGSFNYRGPQDAVESAALFEIKNLNITIHKNEKIGIVGSSGSGKSTLGRLLLGLYQLKSGEFSVDHINFYDIMHSTVTKEIAIVLQETEMFNLSLTDNITLLKKIDPELLAKAIEIAQLQKIIDKLPQGLATVIGEKGYRLSGGERQRIGIARAIYKDPQLFVFDEATSALDSKTESLIQKALEKELHKKTLVVIAHRVSTLKNVDRICVFEKGSLVEEGTYQSLANDPGSKFYEIAQMQNKQSAKHG